MLLDHAAYLQTQGGPRAAWSLFGRALQHYRQRHGDDHPNTLTSAGNLALNLHVLGGYTATRNLHEDTPPAFTKAWMVATAKQGQTDADA